MPKRIEIVEGTVFNDLTYLHDVKSKDHNRKGLFECACGNVKIMPIHPVRLGKIKSCGCKWHTSRIKHGHCVDSFKNCESSIYKRWMAIKYRCYNPNSIDYPRYGGRGITLCKEWHDFSVFLQWAVNSGYNKRLTIDRRNNNKGYNPKNCRWVSNNTQCANREKWEKTKFKYIGVHQIQSKNWQAVLNYKGTRTNIGVFGSEIEAVIARNEYIKENNLPHKLNPL